MFSSSASVSAIASRTDSWHAASASISASQLLLWFDSYSSHWCKICWLLGAFMGGESWCAFASPDTFCRRGKCPVSLELSLHQDDSCWILLIRACRNTLSTASCAESLPDPIESTEFAVLRRNEEAASNKGKPFGIIPERERLAPYIAVVAASDRPRPMPHTLPNAVLRNLPATNAGIAMCIRKDPSEKPTTRQSCFICKFATLSTSPPSLLPEGWYKYRVSKKYEVIASVIADSSSPNESAEREASTAIVENLNSSRATSSESGIGNTRISSILKTSNAGRAARRSAKRSAKLLSLAGMHPLLPVYKEKRVTALRPSSISASLNERSCMRLWMAAVAVAQ
mmetsp:Transcript_4180/g.8445  ORF Transcript_4180/g.8445 Transcript_4180/m.8445 type:complete len:341 (+) Transcript_4180:608-1630(+)